MVHATNSTVNIGVDPSAHVSAKTLATNGIINGLILPKKVSKVDENSNSYDVSTNEQNTFNSCTNEVNTECSCNNIDHDDVNRMDDGTVHNCQCNKMLSTYTKPLKNVGKSFR